MIQFIQSINSFNQNPITQSIHSFTQFTHSLDSFIHVTYGNHDPRHVHCEAVRHAMTLHVLPSPAGKQRRRQRLRVRNGLMKRPLTHLRVASPHSFPVSPLCTIKFCTSYNANGCNTSFSSFSKLPSTSFEQRANEKSPTSNCFNSFIPTSETSNFSWKHPGPTTNDSNWGTSEQNRPNINNYGTIQTTGRSGNRTNIDENSAANHYLRSESDRSARASVWDNSERRSWYMKRNSRSG